MNKALKKGNKLIETIKSTVEVNKLEDMQEFYLTSQKTPFAIRNVQAYLVAGTDMILVLGHLDLAVKTADQAFNYSQQNPQEQAEEAQEQAEEVQSPKEEKVEYTEEDVEIVMAQGEITREEAVDLLEKNEGDPLLALTALGK